MSEPTVKRTLTYFDIKKLAFHFLPLTVHLNFNSLSQAGGMLLADMVLDINDLQLKLSHSTMNMHYSVDGHYLILS